MSFRKAVSRPFKKLERRFAGGRRKGGGNQADVAGGEGVEPTDLPPNRESGAVVGDEYSQGRNEGDGDGGEVDTMGPPQPDVPEAASEDRRELGQGSAGVGEGEVGVMDLSPQLGGVDVPGDSHSEGNDEMVVEGEVGPVDPPPQSDVGTPDNREPSGGTLMVPFWLLPDL